MGHNAMWTRLERNWMADAALVPGFEPSQVTAVRLRHTPSGDPMLGGAISFSNSITIEENTLGPGVVGHLLHARTISPVTFAAVDRWFAYDQVGSILAETDADGELSATHHADAWGNRLEDWDTGVWGGLRVGWAHNTKEIDGLTDLTYMYQRWYAPETGTFLSRAPYPPMMEHEYGFALNEPTTFGDDEGAFPRDLAGSIAQQGDLELVNQYYGGDHLPYHVHVKSTSPEVRDIKVGQNGKPLKGQPELNAREKAFVKKNIKSVRKTVKKIEKLHRAGRLPIKGLAGLIVLTPGAAFADMYGGAAVDALSNGLEVLAPDWTGMCPFDVAPASAIGAMNNTRVLDAIGGDVYIRADWSLW